MVITGDLNTKPWEEDLQPLLAEFSYQFGNTTMFPDGFPSATRPPSKSKVDYIFYSGLKLLSARILEETVGVVRSQSGECQVCVALRLGLCVAGATRRAPKG